MQINKATLQTLVNMLAENNLLNEQEQQRANIIAGNSFEFANQVALAESIHLHVHVADISQIPTGALNAKGGQVTNKAEGYIKYNFDGGINLVFSHIPVAQREKVARDDNAAYLDHIGIDIRSDDKTSYIAFQQIPMIAAEHDYLFTRQGDGKEAVKCCHMQVKEKYWVYPSANLNYEFAFGPLVVHSSTSFGIDLRPANLFAGKLDETGSCCGTPVKETVACCEAQKNEQVKKPAIFI